MLFDHHAYKADSVSAEPQTAHYLRCHLSALMLVAEEANPAFCFYSFGVRLRHIVQERCQLEQRSPRETVRHVLLPVRPHFRRPCELLPDFSPYH
jgi:hypothetical protein